jgi:hypothetical protein
MSPDIVDPCTLLRGPIPLVVIFAFEANSRASIEPVQVVLSSCVNILVLQTVLDWLMDLNTFSMSVWLEPMTTSFTFAICIGNFTKRWVLNTLVVTIEIIFVFALSADFLASQKP